MSDRILSFKNEPSKRFWEFYTKRIKDKTLTREQIAKDFGWKQSYSYSFWKMLSSAQVSVDVSYIEIGINKHGLDPAYIFGFADDMGVSKTPVKYTLIDESFSPHSGDGDVSYSSKEDAILNKEIGKTINEILEKHKVQRTKYAEERLGMTPRNLQRIIAGVTNVTVTTLFKIAEDFAEPLDRFRLKPLPKGHYLQLLKEHQQRIQEQEKVIDALAAAVKADAAKVSEA